jgi:alkylation response protein AidB-like acyl-CoA dehydrogenase
VDLELTDEQAQLRAVASELLDARAPLSLARSFLDGAGDPTDLWEELRDLGWYGVGVDDGDGIGVPGLCVVAFELGRHAAPSLIPDTVVTARILLDAGGERVRSKWLDGLLTGASPAALALLDEAGSWEPERVQAQATAADGHEYLLDCRKLGVHHGSRARVLAVVATVDDAPGLFLIDPAADGVTVTPERALDAASCACSVALDGVAVSREDSLVGDDIASAIERGCRVAAVASAAEALGAASGCLEMAVAYALDRRQYGRAIGSFQAIQHLLADSYVLRETAWSSTLFAAAAIDQQLLEAGEASAIAKAHASSAARWAAEAALQVFGGVGFTWEHDLHLLVRRALAAERRFGDALDHERSVGALLATRLPLATGALSD